MNNKPKYLLVLKIVGFIGIALAIFGIVLAISNFGNFDNDLFMVGGFIACISCFVGVSSLVIGFRPEITKLSIKLSKHIQEENKEDIKDIVNTTVDITGDAISKVSKSIKNGLEEDKMYCKHCGALIDKDSIFCNRCGKEQQLYF